MKKKIAFVFPGQGSQYVGMGKALAEGAGAPAEVFSLAAEVSGIPVRRLCIEGPMEELTETRNLQVCLAAVEIAAFFAAREAGLEAGAVAGHSLGECTALFAAGVLDLADTFALVAERGRLMDEAARTNPGAMAAIIGLSRQEIEGLMEPISKKGILALANHNSPEQIVATGEKALVEELCQAVKEKGKKGIILKVSGAYHSPMMEGPAREFARILDRVDFRPAKVPFYSNVSAMAETDPERIRSLLARQMVSPVRWYEIVTGMKKDGVEAFVELGPKNVLANLVKKCIPEGDIQVFAVEDPKGIKECTAALF